MYQAETRKRYAELLKKAMEKLAEVYGVALPKRETR